MSAFLFTRAILEGRPIDVFNHGDMERDFTYVDDIVEGVVRVLEVIPAGDPQADMAHPDPAPQHGAVPALQHREPPARSSCLQFIETLEQALGRTAARNLLPMQPGDVRADVRGRGRFARGRWFLSEHAAGGGNPAILGLVSGVLPDRTISALELNH